MRRLAKTRPSFKGGWLSKMPKFDNIEITKQRDKGKKQLCEEHNVKLLYFADEKYEDYIIVDKNELLEKIKKI